MAICKNCGNTLSRNDAFCEKCGSRVVAENEYVQQTPVTPVAPAQPANYVYNQQPQYMAVIPDTKKNTLSAWAFFGYSVLFTIPIIGLIFNLVFCFNSSNITRRSFARSYWCWYVIVAIAAIIIVASGASLSFLF